MLASAPALSELDLPREPVSVAAHTAGEHVRELESSGAFSCLKRNLSMRRMRPRKLLALVGPLPRLQICNNCLEMVAKTHGKMRKAEGAADSSSTSHWPRHDPIFLAPSWFNAPPGLGLPSEAGPDNWRNELLYRGGDIERHPGPKRALCEGETSWCRTFCPLLRNATTWPYQNLKNTCESEIHGPDTLVSHGLNDIRNARLCARRLSVMSCPPLAAQCSYSNVFIAYHFQPRPWIVWLVWWLTGSRCSKGSSFSPSQRTLQPEEELERELWDSLEADSWALLISKQHCYETQGNAFAFSEG